MSQLHKMHDIDDLYFLESPLLKILLISGTNECINEMFAIRERNDNTIYDWSCISY